MARFYAVPPMFGADTEEEKKIMRIVNMSFIWAIWMMKADARERAVKEGA
jgi:hypothetical protein